MQLRTILLSSIVAAGVSHAAPAHWHHLPRNVLDIVALDHHDIRIDSPCQPIAIIYHRGNEGRSWESDQHLISLFFYEISQRVGMDGFLMETYLEQDFGQLPSGDFKGPHTVGPATLAFKAYSIARRCPDTKLILAGWGPGAGVLHKTVALLKPDDASKIVSAVITFGDPFINYPFVNIPPDRVVSFCHPEDQVCNGAAPTVNVQHMSYGVAVAKPAAWFAIRKAYELRGLPGDETLAPGAINTYLDSLGYLVPSKLSSDGWNLESPDQSPNQSEKISVK